MNPQPLSLLFIEPGDAGHPTGGPPNGGSARTNGDLSPWRRYLSQIAHLSLTQHGDLPEDLSRFDVVLLGNAAALNSEARDSLQSFVAAGGGCLAFTGLSEEALPEFFGAQPCAVGPPNELRVLFDSRSNRHADEASHPLAARLPEAAYLSGSYHPLRLTHESTETVLYADWRYEHSPVLVQRRMGRGRVACTTLQDLAHPWLQRVLYRLVRQLAVVATEERVLGVGLLGYSPAVGRLHGCGTQATAGLALRAICDLNSQRRATASEEFPHAQIHAAVADLCEDDTVNLVIVATPPSTHAELALQLLAGGKHVICEKPLALSTAETDAMRAAATERGLHLSCHQNRRWDVDYVAIRAALLEGTIGEPFYMETFVGGFEHPCGYWHSHEAISGGTTFDWGAHYLDWMLNLMPEPVVSVMGTRQNRVWHDVTNADQERIQLRFAGGQEAEFTHSDIAAARKPKWYILGTSGAIVGEWQNITGYTPNELHYFDAHAFPSTEVPSKLTLHRRHPGGGVTGHELPVPEREQFPFHANLADHLLLGEPLEAPVSESARVVAVLEAAASSAEDNGTQKRVHI